MPVTDETRDRNRRRLHRMGLLSSDAYTELTGERPPDMHDDSLVEQSSADELRADLDRAVTPEQRRRQAVAAAEARRDRDLRFLMNAEKLALAGQDEPTAKAIRQEYAEERQKVADRFERAKTEARRQEDVSSTSRAVADEFLAHGGPVDIADRWRGPGMIQAEAQRRGREVEDRHETDVAAARLADQDAARHGRTTSHEVMARARIAAELAKLDRWERSPEAEAWARQRLDDRRQERQRQVIEGANGVPGRASRRRALADEIARHEAEGG